MRADRFLLEDILESIDEALESTPQNRAEFDENKFIRSHVLRQLQIIGEAASRLSSELKDHHPEVPWRTITGMRHVIVHDYFEIDWNEVYGTSTRDLPILKPAIKNILKTLSADENPE